MQITPEGSKLNSHFCENLKSYTEKKPATLHFS
jgi:hypothetical protein